MVNSSRVGFPLFVMGLMVASCCTSSVLGQGFSGGRGGFGDGVSSLLKKTSVQKEVELSAEQTAAFQKLVEEDRSARDVLLREFDYAAFDKLPKPEQEKKREALSQKTKERTRVLDQQVKSLLSSRQWTRLNEIRIQQQGVWSFESEDVQKELGLTQDQIAKINALVKKANEPFGGNDPLSFSPEERLKAREINEARRQSFEKEMLAVLNTDQATAWNKLKGAPFEIKR